jgi:outer membrane immunogenic protein
MRCTLRLGIAAAALMAGSGAFAADIPRKALPPSVAPFYNWTGFYVGGNVGYGWVHGSGTITMGPASGPVSGSGHGLFGGLQAGYNYQIGSMVLGVEVDGQFSGQKGTFNGNAGPNFFTSSATVPWFATARGRVGYAFDRTMIYLTGGGVFGDGKIDGTSTVTGPFTVSKTYFTYTAGAGIEHALWSRWTAKLEYLYVGTPNHVPVPPTTTNITGSITSHLLRLGLNYRF